MDQGLINGITWGGWHWVTPGSPTPVINYYFATAGELSSYDTNWTSIEKAGYRAALQAWANVANVSFVEVNSAASATFIEHSVPGSYFSSDPGLITLGVHDVPDNPPPADGYYNYEGPGWDYGDSNGGLQVGGFGFLTLVHELGHALGLAHPHDNGGGSTIWPGVTGPFSAGTYNLSQDINTVMSYVHGLTTKPVDGGPSADNYGYVAGPMAFDIAAIQQLYGANMTFHTGNDVYTLPDANTAGTYFSCIWDAGGADWMVYNGARTAVINLNYASLDFAPNGGGDLSRASGIFGGFTIAHGVWIENARGGSGLDIIIGNALANFIDGGPSSDYMGGLAGNDTYRVDSAADIVDESSVGSNGFDTVQSATLSINLLDTTHFRGSIEAIALIGTAALSATGNGLANLIFGNTAANAINGGAGGDLMYGLGGNDGYIVDNAADIVDEGIAGSGGGDTVRSSNLSINLTDAVHFRGSIENAVLLGAAALYAAGNGLANVLVGNAGANYLFAGANNDVLDGSLGNDMMWGQSGNDAFRFDTALGSTNLDTIADFTNVVGNDDTFQLENLVFSALVTTGTLDSAFFHVGAAAADNDDFIVYNRSTGALYYDANGNLPGGAIQFAFISNHAVLSNADFFVF